MRVCGPGIIADSCTHHRYLIRRNPAQGHHHVMSRAAPGVPSCDVRNTGAGSDTSQDRKLSRFTQCSPLFRILTFIGLNIYLLNKCQMKWMWHTFLIHTVDDSVYIFLHCKSSILCLQLMPLMWGQSGHQARPAELKSVHQIRTIQQRPVPRDKINLHPSIKHFTSQPPRHRHPQRERLKANHFSWCPHPQHDGFWPRLMPLGVDSGIMSAMNVWKTTNF